MAAKGAAMQTQNNELVNCIEEMRVRRDEVQHQIQHEEEEKSKLQQEVAVLTKQLAQLNSSLARKVATRQEYDKVIQETDLAYSKIVESSQMLLTVLKRESVNLQSTRPSGGIPAIRA